MSSPRPNLDEIRKQIQLTESARQLHLAVNPPHDPSVLSQSSSAYLERAQQEVKANDQAIGRIIVDDVTAADEEVREEKETKEPDINNKHGLIIPKLSDNLSKTNIASIFFRVPQQVLFCNLATFFLLTLQINTSVPPKSDAKALNALALTCRRTYALFQDSLNDIRLERVRQIAKLILSAEQKEVEEAVAQVKKNPSFLNYSVRVTDPKGRAVEGDLLQIAAMAGDFNLKKDLEEKTCGIVERLAEAARLSKKETDKRLQVITSEQAQLENEKRNQRVLNAVKAFGLGIIKVRAELEDKAEEEKQMSFEELQTHCKNVIDQFEKDLQGDPKEVIKLGFIFDPKILRDTTEWFEKNVTHFGGWWSIQSDIFWVNGIGKLQNYLSARDAQVIRAGIGNFVDNGTVPPRTLKNNDGSSYFFNSSSHLGVGFYIGSFGRAGRLTGPHASDAVGFGCALGILMSSKNSSIAKLTQRPDNPKRQRTCLIM